NTAGQHQQAFTVAIRSSAPLAFTNSTPSAGIASTPYSFVFTTNATSTPTFIITAGSLPPGLQLDATGLLHGTPTTAGSFSFTITASNTTGQHQQTFTISVKELIYLPLIKR
ncbi:MAG: hypothetical protein HGA19_21110, partial [Oscillochloris sp.]|nr:hypothetical protein [Oscillochloris sp.]